MALTPAPMRTSSVPPARPHPGWRRGKAVFVDKDGTLVHDVPYNVDPALLRFTPGALTGLQLLTAAGYDIVVITNQPGIAQGRFDAAALARLQQALTTLLRRAGVPLAGFYACPHAPAADAAGAAPGCGCRKPAPGLLRQAADALGLDLGASWMVGDILDDVEAGHRAGCRSVLLDVGNETLWQMSLLRTPELRVANLLEAARQILACDEAEAAMPHCEGVRWID